jgi:hypothetical protein
MLSRVLIFWLLIMSNIIGSEDLHNPGFGWCTSTDVNSRYTTKHTTGTPAPQPRISV